MIHSMGVSTAPPDPAPDQNPLNQYDLCQLLSFHISLGSV